MFSKFDMLDTRVCMAKNSFKDDWCREEIFAIKQFHGTSTNGFKQRKFNERSMLLIDTFRRFVSSVFFCDTFNDNFFIGVSYSAAAIDFFFFFFVVP